ncbi:MAG: hypothetical protein IJJ56_03305 [Prevotella sp.]|nr:hypothetical protein [Prevotella sp.]
MATTTSIPNPAQMIITLEDNALVADIKRALKLIRGIASVRVATISDDKTITSAMRRSINKARRELAKGETIKCSTPPRRCNATSTAYDTHHLRHLRRPHHGACGSSRGTL